MQAQQKFPQNLVRNNPSLPLIYVDQLGGGYWQVADITARNNIPQAKRAIGMAVSCVEVGSWVTKRYEGADLSNVEWINPANWIELGGGGIVEDSGYVKTTGATYQHDSLYIKKLLSGGKIDMVSGDGLWLTNSNGVLNYLINKNGDFSSWNTNTPIQAYQFTSGAINTWDRQYSTLPAISINPQSNSMSLYDVVSGGGAKYFDITSGRLSLPKAQDKDNNLDSVLVYEPLTGQFKVRDASSLGGGVDTTALKTTGKTYQHDSLYVDKLFVQSTGAINSNVYTVPTTSTTNGISWSGMGVSIKSPTSTLLGFYSGANQTLTVASSFVSFAGNLFAAVGNTYNIGTSANPFKDLYIGSVTLKTTPNVSTGDSVLVRRQSTGLIEMRLASTLTPSLTTNYIGFGSGSNKVTGSSDFTWNNAAKELYANGSGYFGGVNGVARLNITASGTGGTSKGLSIFENGITEKVAIFDNGKIWLGTVDPNDKSMLYVRSLSQASDEYAILTTNNVGSHLFRVSNLGYVSVGTGHVVTEEATANLHVKGSAGGNMILAENTNSINNTWIKSKSNAGGIFAAVGCENESGYKLSLKSYAVGYVYAHLDNKQAIEFGNELIFTKGNGTSATDIMATLNTSGNLTVKAGVTVGDILTITPQSATTASAITPSDGMVIYVNTTDATFTSVGIWARENGTWVKL